MLCALLFLTLIAPDPQATCVRIQVDYEEARKRVWWTHKVLDPIYAPTSGETWSNPPIEDLTGWTIIEHARSFPDPQSGALLDGLIDTTTQTIQYNASSRLRPLVHEFTHFIFFKHQWPYGTLWFYAGHGGLSGVYSLDIMTHALWFQLCEILFSPFCSVNLGHQYSPQALLQQQLQAASSLQCRTVHRP